MKERILVMNGQKLVQSESNGVWGTDHVGKAGDLKPAIYNIHLAVPADKTKAHDGVIVHANDKTVFQQVGKAFVAHELSNFEKQKPPKIGENLRVKYNGGKAEVSPSAVKLGRGI